MAPVPKTQARGFFVDSVDLLLDRLDTLTHDSSLSSEDKLDQFLGLTLELARTSFKEKHAVKANFAAIGEDEKLRITKVDPPATEAEYDPGFSPRIGEGGSGFAAANRGTVYFPWVWIRHAIHVAFDRGRRPARLKSKGVCLDLYIPVKREYTAYRSILSTTVAWEDSAPFGVLNFDSKKIDAFSEIDFKIANVYAQLLGLAFKRFSVLTLAKKVPAV